MKLSARQRTGALLGAALAMTLGCSTPPPSGLASNETGAQAATFSEPPQLGADQREGRTVTVDLTATTARVDLGGGKTAEVLSYNGAYPGPTIDVREGDRLVVNFKNALSEPTSVHWHGLRVPAGQDDAMETIAPGAGRTYAFDIPAGSAGTYWYHPHLHGTVASQVAKGLFGAIRVRAAADPLPAEVGDSLAVLSDLRLDASGRATGPAAAERANGFEGDMVLVNGRQSPLLALRPGETRRLRLLNAAASRYFRLGTSEQALTLVATDGGYIDKPVRLGELLLAPGERAELLVKAPASGTITLRALAYDRGMASMTAAPTHGGHGASHRRVLHDESHATAMPLVTLRAEGTAAPDVALPPTLAAVPRLPIEDATTRAITFSEDHMAGDFFINGQKFDASRVDIQAKLGTTELWTVKNTGHMDHPFHLHGYAFQVIDRNGRAEPYLGWKDTVNVKPAETVRFAVKYDGFPGLRVFHCHILDHEDLGMMGIFRVD